MMYMLIPVQIPFFSLFLAHIMSSSKKCESLFPSAMIANNLKHKLYSLIIISLNEIFLSADCSVSCFIFKNSLPLFYISTVSVLPCIFSGVSIHLYWPPFISCHFPPSPLVANDKAGAIFLR